MDSSKYDRSISLMCPTCGHKEFAYDESGEGPVRCTGCDREFTREELIAENGEVISGEVEALKPEILNDMRKEIRDTLKNAFKGSKHIRFK
jgi:DNA-directed RNA polymerase subunit RPC12/RpoP